MPFDLPIGILFPFLPGTDHRDDAMNTVAPVWDGNETSLVLGGGGLLAVFPLACAVTMPALYAPIIAMPIGLIFRGVAFEFRWRITRWKAAWDVSFFADSLIAAFSQGIILGALIQGKEVADRAYAGGWWDWLTPFSVMCGVALTVGYALLGTTWLIMKTDQTLILHAYKLAWKLTFAMAVVMGIVSLWTPFCRESGMLNPTWVISPLTGLIKTINVTNDTIFPRNATFVSHLP